VLRSMRRSIPSPQCLTGERSCYGVDCLAHFYRGAWPTFISELTEALLLVWDNAPWHVSRAVRTWIRAHNRRVKWSGRGVRIVNCYLPIKSPWLNPIEPKWGHGKRRVVEPTRLLSAAELIDRVYAAFACDHLPQLAIPAKVA
jgi:hypothetical protein